MVCLSPTMGETLAPGVSVMATLATLPIGSTYGVGTHVLNCRGGAH
jgi:hypothetical protein